MAGKREKCWGGPRGESGGIGLEGQPCGKGVCAGDDQRDAFVPERIFRVSGVAGVPGKVFKDPETYLPG